MPFCPKCEAEYVEGIWVCADCGEELVRELPPKPDFSREKTVVVFEILYQDYLIGMLKGLLEDNGIPCIVNIGTDILAGYRSPKKLAVLEKDAPRAKEIIEAYFHDVEEEK